MATLGAIVNSFVSAVIALRRGWPPNECWRGVAPAYHGPKTEQRLTRSMRRAARPLGLGGICTAIAFGVTVPARGDADGEDSKATAAQSPARFDQDLRLKGLAVPVPSFGDTILLDVGGFRTALAEHGIGVILVAAPQMAVNMLDTPRQSNGIQAYWGQRFSAFSPNYLGVTVDMKHYGIPGGQLQVVGQLVRSSWQPYVPNTLSFNRLAYFQSLFDDHLELMGGYIVNGQGFIGTFLGSNLASPFGPAVSIPFEIGLSNTLMPAPTLEAVFRASHFYNQFAVQRSMPPTLTSFITNERLNPTGLRFKLDQAKALVIDEVGYKREATPAKRYVWGRLAAIYNNSRYTDFSQSGKTAKNFGSYLLVDHQIYSSDPSSQNTAQRGLYVGGSAMYAAPKTNVVSQYYEARAYFIGPFSWRPVDQAGLVYFHQVFSRYLRDATNLTSSFLGVFGRSSSNTVTASYTARILPGLYVTLGLSFTDHPSFRFVPGEGSAVNFLASLFIAL